MLQLTHFMSLLSVLVQLVCLCLRSAGQGFFLNSSRPKRHHTALLLSNESVYDSLHAAHDKQALDTEAAPDKHACFFMVRQVSRKADMLMIAGNTWVSTKDWQLDSQPSQSQLQTLQALLQPWHVSADVQSIHNKFRLHQNAELWISQVALMSSRFGSQAYCAHDGCL